MRLYWGRRLCCTTWAFATLASCVLPEVISTPPDESSAVASEATTAMSSEPPPPADAPTMLESEPGLQTEAGAAGEAGAVSGGAAGETATEGQPTAAPATNAMCFRCDGALLRKCSDAPDAKPLAECTSAALCDARAGKCLSAMCAPNTATCKYNVLSKCNAQGTAYEETVCGSKVCSESHRSCDLCAMFKECDGDTIVECDLTGQSYVRTRCQSAAPRCRQGRCVRCVSDSDCPPALNSCNRSYCDVGSTLCKVDPLGLDARCTLSGSSAQGYCNQNDECVEEPSR